MIFLKGYILYTIGGAAILMGLIFLFPQIAVKGATKEETEEKIEKIKSPRNAVISIIVGVALLVLGYIFKF